VVITSKIYWQEMSGNFRHFPLVSAISTQMSAIVLDRLWGLKPIVATRVPWVIYGAQSGSHVANAPEKPTFPCTT
jgi:hypothetical protein